MNTELFIKNMQTLTATEIVENLKKLQLEELITVNNELYTGENVLFYVYDCVESLLECFEAMTVVTGVFRGGLRFLGDFCHFDDNMHLYNSKVSDFDFEAMAEIILAYSFN